MFFSGTVDFVSSIRSLLGPARRMMFARSCTVGLASAASGLSCSRKRRSFGATGLDSSTSGLRSSSVARRFTNVEFAVRMNGGSCASASASARFWRPIALVVDDAAGLDLARLRAVRELEVDVAVRDTGERRLPDDRLRALAQRHVAVVGDLERDVGLAVGRQVDVRDLADRGAGHLDEVAL